MGNLVGESSEMENWGSAGKRPTPFWTDPGEPGAQESSTTTGGTDGMRTEING